MVPLLKFKVPYLTVVIRRRKCEILKCLSPIVADTALAALEDLKKAYTADGANYSLSPLDHLVRAVLYLHQCDPDQAQTSLCAIPKKQLVEVLTTHYYLLHEDGLHFTPLAQCLRKHEQTAFMEVLLHLHDKHVLSLETLLTLLGTSKPDAFQNDLALGFLEAVLSGMLYSNHLNEELRNFQHSFLVQFFFVLRIFVSIPTLISSSAFLGKSPTSSRG